MSNLPGITNGISPVDYTRDCPFSNFSNLGYLAPKGCTSMKVFFSVGEPSGDLHGANLIKELRQQNPGIECVGYGGPKMADAGCQLHADLTVLAVMWILRALLNLHHFWRLYRRAGDYFRDERPDAVVLIDYPGFNWWIARAAKKCGIPVFYYGVPQMWGWAGWRVRKMRRLVDHVLCKLPFEADWYRQRHCHATYLGHPYFDEVQRQRPDQAFLDAQSSRAGRLVTILPGSRTQEVVKNLQGFLITAAEIHRRVPDARFAIAGFNEKQAAMARGQVAGLDFPVDVFVGRTPELIRLSHCCLACSGSVSLELLAHAKPTVIMYRVGWLFYTLGRTFFMKVKFITLVNLMAAEDPFLRGGAKYDPRAASDDRRAVPGIPDLRRSLVGDGGPNRPLVDRRRMLPSACARPRSTETAVRRRWCFESRCDVHPAASASGRGPVIESAFRTGKDARRRQAAHKKQKVGLT
jgi:lipid-A-disaccharide synthase